MEFSNFFFVDYLLIENKHIVDGGGCWWLVAGQEKCWMSPNDEFSTASS